jgi:hypothetical protein
VSDEYDKQIEQAADKYANAIPGIVDPVLFYAFIDGANYVRANPPPELLKEISRLNAKIYVLKDAQLRTYDGLAQRASKFDKLKALFEQLLSE